MTKAKTATHLARLITRVPRLNFQSGRGLLGSHRVRESLALLFILALAQNATAHDFWLASSPWEAKPGTSVVVTANVGDDTYPRSESATAADRIESLRLVGPETQVLAPTYRTTEESLAAQVVLPTAPATYMAVMVVKGRLLSMEGPKFLEYLEEEGLQKNIEEVHRRGEDASKSRERYWRDAKTLIRAGDGPSGHIIRPAGLPAELVPDSDFTNAALGDVIGVRLMAQGRPVADAQITFTAAGPGPTKSRAVSARTDAEGRARFTILKQGPYLFTSVYMVRREGETGPLAADWESYWCSLTFNVHKAHLP